MKRFAALLMILVCFAGFATAETDLSSMSYDELVALNRKIAAEIMSRPEWKEVKVPAGVYIIGEDIPAGTYSVTAEKWIVTMKYFTNAKTTYYDYYQITSGNSLGKITLTEGMKIDLSGNCIFAPPLELGF